MYKPIDRHNGIEQLYIKKAKELQRENNKLKKENNALKEEKLILTMKLDFLLNGIVRHSNKLMAEK